jgi:hypothetical protein
MILKKTILDLCKIPQPLGTESYIVDGIRLELSVPFSQVIVRKLNVAKEQVLKKYQLYMEEDEGENNQVSQDTQMEHYTEIVKQTVPDILDLPVWYLNLYSDDFLDVTLAPFSGNMKREEYQLVIVHCCRLLAEVICSRKILSIFVSNFICSCGILGNK